MGSARYLCSLGFSHVFRIGPGNAMPSVVDRQHDERRLRLVFLEILHEHLDDELSGRVVVVVEDDVEASRPLRLTPGLDGDVSLFIGRSRRARWRRFAAAEHSVVLAVSILVTQNGA